MSTIVQEKIARILEISYDLLDSDTKQAMADNPGTTMSYEGDLAVFSCAGIVYCTVERSWLESDSTELPELELVDGSIPDYVPLEWI